MILIQERNQVKNNTECHLVHEKHKQFFEKNQELCINHDKTDTEPFGDKKNPNYQYRDIPNSYRSGYYMVIPTDQTGLEITFPDVIEWIGKQTKTLKILVNLYNVRANMITQWEISMKNIYSDHSLTISESYAYTLSLNFLSKNQKLIEKILVIIASVLLLLALIEIFGFYAKDT